ncbi:prepilin-type N-terminal cleavage/methylation domain-containing protein [Rubripirellula amarantea]|nr:prepilin-type N-terminal cleavage/methylation domain-containing protein [Rubripirellula amarantea]
MNSKRGFTLIELLVSIVIIGIIGGMVSQALSSANQQARQVRNQSLVDRVNLSVLQFYDELSSVGVSASSSEAGSTPDIQRQARRSLGVGLLVWRRDYLRCSMPNSIRDLTDSPVNITYPVFKRPPGGATPEIRWARLDPLEEVASPPSNFAAWTGGTGRFLQSGRFSQIKRYRDRVRDLIRYNALGGSTRPTWAECIDGNLTNGEWTTQHQSAECLYLIMVMNTLNGEPMINLLTDQEIDDTDEDGVPEIVDAFGNPLGFIRWPTGYYLQNDWVDPTTTAAPSAALTDVQRAELKRQLGRDSLDIALADPRFGTAPVATAPEADDPFYVLPLVVSAGSDGTFDMAGLETTSPRDYQYVSTYPTVATGWMLVVPPPAIGNSFVDPYLTATAAIDQPIQLRPGAILDLGESDTPPSSGDKLNSASDNVFPTFSLRP